MPTILQLTDGTLTVDMVTNTAATLKMLENYAPVFSEPTGDGTIPPPLTESLPVYIQTGATADNDIGAAIQDVAQIGRYAAEYKANNQQTPVWFYRTMQDETAGTRTLVYAVRFTADARFRGYFDRPPGACAGRTGILTITHHAYNERTTAVAASGSNNVSVIGGAVNYTDIPGDVSARLYYLNIDNIAAGKTYRRVWAGLRSDRRAGGDAGNVASLWELEDGTIGVNTAKANEPTASPGGVGNTIMQCTFANPAWASRSSIQMSDVTANYANQVGAFVVLLRAQVANASNPAQVKLRQIGNNGAVYREGPTVEIDVAAWTLYPLGTCEFPGRDLHATPTALFAATYDQRDGFEVYGRQSPSAGGAPSLDMDCLILIPADEYLIQVQSAEAGEDDAIYVTVSPEDTGAAQNVDGVSNWFNIHCPVSIIGSGIPEGDGRLFIALATSNAGAAPTFTDTFDVELSPFIRYVGFRGAD